MQPLHFVHQLLYRVIVHRGRFPDQNIHCCPPFFALFSLHCAKSPEEIGSLRVIFFIFYFTRTSS